MGYNNYGPYPAKGYRPNGSMSDQEFRRSSSYGRDYGAQRVKKKRSGCKEGVGKNGHHYVQGWNWSKRLGLVTFIACQRKGGASRTGTVLSNTCVTKAGVQQDIYVVSIKVGMQTLTHTGFYSHKDGKLRMPELGMTASPKAPNGGYWGRTVPKKR